MAYDNKGGKPNALAYFNNMAEARYGAMMKAKDGLIYDQVMKAGGSTDSVYQQGGNIDPVTGKPYPMTMSMGVTPPKSYKDMTRKERKAEADRLGIKKISKKYRK